MRRTGKIAPYLDESGHILPGSVAEIARLPIGGLEQGMILKGRNAQNPVLLFLHGGPGNPEYILAKGCSLHLEDYFTVCWWDQRGCGMSYTGIKPGTITLEQMVNDTVEVANYLRGRFGKEKIYVMGHSWGSFLGVQAVSQYPQLFEAYIGVGQVTNQLESEKLAYDYMLDFARRAGDAKTVRKLSAYHLTDADSITMKYLMLRASLAGKLGIGVFHEPRSNLSLMSPYFLAREYTLRDKYGLVLGLGSVNQPMSRAQLLISLAQAVPRLAVPVCIIHGVYDMQVSYQLSREYFDALEAPVKRFYAFEHSAHSPLFEEPERFMQIIRQDVLHR